jgi:HEPN superfamily Apea-like protein/ApeA-like protein
MSFDIIRLTEKFTSPGIFWDPEDKQPFSATLIYEPEEPIELQAATTQSDFEHFLDIPEKEIPLLVGILSDGKLCNLLRVRMKSKPSALTPIGVIVSAPVFYAHLALIGEAISLETQPEVDELQVMSEGLQFLCGLPAIGYGNHEGNVTIHFPNRTEPLLCADAGNLTVKFKFERNISTGVFGHAEGSYEPLVTIARKDSKDLDSYLDIVGQIVGLLTILLDQHAAPFAIRVIQKGQSTGDKTRMAYVLFNYIHDFPTRKPQPDAVCTFASLGANASAVVGEWFKSDEKARRVFNLYLGTLYTRAYVESHFLSLAQALESFHRVFHDFKVMPNNVFEQLRVALLGALHTVPLPNGLADKLAGGFGFLNEPNFQTRIEQLISTLQPETRKVLIGDSVEDFIRALKQTRNYLTHPGIQKKGAVLSEPLEYHIFNRRLQATLRLLILRQLGVSEPIILSAICAGLRDLPKMQ